MGITKVVTEFLLEAHDAGLRFGRTMTLGRQCLFVSPRVLERLIVGHKCWPASLSRREFYDTVCQNPYYVDPLLKLLGAQEVSAIDYSDYEGARYIHDLNQPVSADLKEQFDLVLDGGLLEHVFNLPVALKSCMEMVKPGGRLIITTPANNYFGHGLYQFGPELFFRTLTEENGFHLERIQLVEYDLYPWRLFGQDVLVETATSRYEVTDPATIRQRTLMINHLPAGLLVQARKTRCTPIFVTPPQQSDYVELWDQYSEANKGVEAIQEGSSVSFLDRVRLWLKDKLPLEARLHIRLYWAPLLLRQVRFLGYGRVMRYQSLRNRKFFRPVKE